MYIWWITVSPLIVGLILANPCLTWATGSKDADVNPVKEYKCGEHIPLKGKRANNSKVGDGEFPFLASITVIEQNSTIPTTPKLVYNCSGALISNRRILTSIKCIGGRNNSSDVKYEIRLGSAIFDGGVLVKVKKMDNISYDLYSPEEGDEMARHGLALIRLSRKRTYILYNGTTTTRGAKRRAYNNNYKNLSINRVCFNKTRSKPTAQEDDLEDVELFAPSWFPSSKRAKAIPFKVADCPGESSGRALCANQTISKIYGYLQEGAPLVRYTGIKRWKILGIHSNRFEPWADCEDDQCASETQNFIPVHEKKLSEWLVKLIY